MWDIAGDAWEDFDSTGTLQVATLFLDEPKVEVVLFTDDARIPERIVSYILEKLRIGVSNTYRIRYTYSYMCFIGQIDHNTTN
ncbi:hypothetical protein Lal_00033964 [Lupinus albus]|nr:hypothetical protein Lal_00033964 [Lupinus albus]